MQWLATEPRFETGRVWLPAEGLLRQEGERIWSLHPYDGCLHACVLCPLRLAWKDERAWRWFERQAGVRKDAMQTFSRALDGLAVGLGEDPVRFRLGIGADPWQPVEERTRIARGLLMLLSERSGFELEVRTRSSLIARDSDVLAALARRQEVSVTIALPALDDRINRLLEPQAPSTFRRLASLEALAKAGVPVGLELGPVLVGLTPEELGLEVLLARVANAGARFATLRWGEVSGAARERFLAHVTAAYPDRASKYRRLLGRKVFSHDEHRRVEERFLTQCARLGLSTGPKVPPRPTPPAQLSLF